MQSYLIFQLFCAEMTQDLRLELTNSAARNECSGFIVGDPIQFPHRYNDTRDIEISAFVSAWMAYGSRKVFLGVLERIHSMMDAQGGPAAYILSARWNEYKGKSDCLYRFYVWNDFYMLCERLNSIYMRMDSMEGLFLPDKSLSDGVLCLCREFEGVKGIPVPGSTSANKRLYMFLRWMVRRNSQVDFGIWNSISPGDLIIPLDTHVYQVAVRLGLTKRKAADLKAAIEITRALARIWPDDPARGDFALYGSEVM